MSTPIETNTEQLQEVLQQVYNLPLAGGSSSTPDLVIKYEAPSGSYFSTDTVRERLSVESMNFDSLVGKLQNLENVVCHIKTIAYYANVKYSGVITAESIMHDDYRNVIHVIFVFPDCGAFNYGKYRVGVIISSDRTLYGVYVNRISTAQ